MNAVRFAAPFLAAALSLFAAAPAIACSCLARTAEQILAEPVVVFTGTAVSSTPAGDGMSVRTEFAVETVWKGEAMETVAVAAPVDSAACGVVFDSGRSYIVAMHPAPDTGGFTTNLCTMLPFLDPPNLDAVQAALRAYREDNTGGGAEPASHAGADESGFDLSGRDLAGVSFAGADLTDGSLSGSHLAGANFAGADLRGVDLRGADLTGARFAGAELDDVDFTGARLAGTDFSGASFTGGSLRDVDFADADLSGATLDDVDLGGANLSAAVLHGADVSGARYDGRTAWPEGFEPAAAGTEAAE